MTVKSHNEDLLEQLYLEFTDSRKTASENERLLFKSNLRMYAEKVSTPKPVGYTYGEWYCVQTIDEMEAFYESRLPAIRAAARKHGYAIGVHGSKRRDFDLMALPWKAECSNKEILAHAIAQAACGISRKGAYSWEQKLCGRSAATIPICWTPHTAEFKGMLSAGCIDLSLIEYKSFDTLTIDLEEARLKIKSLEHEVAQWKNHHKCEVERARVLKERPDLPFERVQAYEAFGILQQEVAELNKLLMECKR